MHFIIHGVHHDHPNDKLRLVMPPAPASRWRRSSSGSSRWSSAPRPPIPLFAGFIVGYLVYDYMHYYLHHHDPKTKLGKRLREQHMRHHFQDHRYGFGVSSPIWDAVFRTLPRKRTQSRPVQMHTVTVRAAYGHTARKEVPIEMVTGAVDQARELLRDRIRELEGRALEAAARSVQPHGRTPGPARPGPAAGLERNLAHGCTTAKAAAAPAPTRR